MYGDDKLASPLPRKAWAKGSLEGMRENGRRQVKNLYAKMSRVRRIKAEKRKALAAAAKRAAQA